MTDFDIRNLDRLDSATKYPSIPTYHTLGERGILTEEVQVPFEDGDEVSWSEKVDGTNGRIVQLPGGDWFIGSRKELLTARDDRVPNKALGIVEELRATARLLPPLLDGASFAKVWYLEVYGHGIGAMGKAYTGGTAWGHILFDVARVPLEVLEWERERIATWRDSQNGQQFLNTEELQWHAQVSGGQEVVPGGELPTSPLPTSVEGTYAMLMELLSDGVKPQSLVTLDGQGTGQPEGIVVRTFDRSKIAKLRFEDYIRTLKRRGGN
jgi:hypothetical protein